MQHFGEADYEIEKAIAVHHGTPYIAKNCECWEGYKRVPGTKPCAPGSCEKCDSSSKESATKLSDEANDRLDVLWNQAVKIAKAQNLNIDESLKDEILMGCLGEIGFKALTPEIIANKIIQKSNRMVMASQGDKPSPHAAQAVFAALASGNEEEAKELLKKTDCPEECETHPEGKCNHQYMSAGRTRVRYLINDSSFDKEASKKEAIFGSGIARRLFKMIAGGACPVCEGKGNIKKIRCKACDGSGSSDKIVNFGKRKWGELTEGNLPEAVDFFRDEMGFSSLEDDDDWGSFDEDEFLAPKSDSSGVGSTDSWDDDWDDEFDDLNLDGDTPKTPAPQKDKPKLLDRFRKKDPTPKAAPATNTDSWLDEFDDINWEDNYDEVDQLLAPAPAVQPQQQDQGIWDKTKQYFQGQPQQTQQQAPAAAYGTCPTCNTPYQDALQECYNQSCPAVSDLW